MKLISNSGTRSLFTRWWFWLGLVVLIGATWYAVGYIRYEGSLAGIKLENAAADAYWRAMQAESALLEAKYKSDTYGGDTPEETLRLFVEALEKGNFELAAKYYVPERQKDMLKEIRLGAEENTNHIFVDAYRNGAVKSPVKMGISGIYEFEVYGVGETIPFRPRLIENTFTKKWKILEF